MSCVAINKCYSTKYILLASETLEPGFPKDISVETTQHWLHELGYKVLSSKKDVCYGHEREDVA